jgi:hypothetical protein
MVGSLIGETMQLNKKGQIEATARIYRKGRQWVICIDDLPDWLVETIKDEIGSGFDNAALEDEYDNGKTLFLETRFYPG